MSNLINVTLNHYLQYKSSMTLIVIVQVYNALNVMYYKIMIPNDFVINNDNT